MQLNPHLGFNGQCQTAFEFYAKSLKGKINLMLRYGDSPAARSVPPEWRQKILHATLVIGAQTLTGADAPPNQYQKPQGFSVLLQIDTAAEAERIFNALAEGGTVQMPLAETFWAKRFGMLVDRFGIPWLLNCGAGERGV